MPRESLCYVDSRRCTSMYEASLTANSGKDKTTQPKYCYTSCLNPVWQFHYRIVLSYSYYVSYASLHIFVDRFHNSFAFPSSHDSIELFIDSNVELFGGKRKYKPPSILVVVDVVDDIVAADAGDSKFLPSSLLILRIVGVVVVVVVVVIVLPTHASTIAAAPSSFDLAALNIPSIRNGSII